MREFIGRKTLLTGEVGTGKTKFLARFIEYLLESGYEKEVTLIDMAPNRFQGVGGSVKEYLKDLGGIRYLRPPIVYAPRLMGRDALEVSRYCEENRKNIEPLLDTYILNPTNILLINDLTIYLHTGDLEKMLKAIELSKTFMATAYSGVKLRDDKGSGISEREKTVTDKLKEKMDLVIHFYE
ncbi:MAG: hypothetical protein QXK95_04335 [Nitrososphaerota archaeon]|nr:hypothetical protein [Candidatus Geocrenenecus dongiae]